MAQAGPGNRVCQHQSTFGIGIVDFNRCAVAGPRDRAGLHGVRTYRVFRQRQHAHDANGKTKFCDGKHQAQYVGRPAHVVLHGVHAGAFLQPQTTGIEGDAFTYVATHRTVRNTLIVNGQQPRRTGSAFTDGMK